MADADSSLGQTVVSRYCTGCHNSKTKAGSLAIDPTQAADPGRNPEVWEQVVRKLRARNMPPAGLPRPDEATYESFVSSLEAALDRAAAAKPDPGRTDTFRRLNRTEYQNAIRDLLDIEVDVAALLPGDEASHGFDNVTVGDLSPTLLERYLTAAQRIARLAVGAPLKSPGGDTINLPPDLTQEEHFDELPLGTRGGLVVRYTFPVNAQYDFNVRLARDRNEHVEGLYEEHQVELTVDGERIGVLSVRPPPPGNDHQAVDKHLTFRAPITAGPHLVMVTFPKKPSMLLETERQSYQAHFNMDRHPRIQPAVYSLSINGPYQPTGAGDTPSRRRIFACHPETTGQQDECAKKIVARLARRAYRRPVTDADLAAPLRFYRQGVSNGFEAGIEVALRSILVSPEFLFRVEQDPAEAKPGTPYAISQFALASRLSFFLWSSIPDDELLDLAERGKLTDPAVLEKQVKRMLADQRSRSLTSNFASQWLHLRSLASVTPDMRIFPDFDDNLRQAFRHETELFFDSILREDRSALDLLHADYTFLNERLAKHYGIPGIYGSRFRRVEFDAQTPLAVRRGGLLRHGSVLTVSSYATRTSPVLRGKWILDNLLGLPPPPPPPVVPALKENTGSGKPLSVRERLAQHRANPVCAGCHQLMDPVGFSLENFDAVGRWRITEDTVPIDSSGSLLDGKAFDGVGGLEAALLARPEIFATTLTEKLLTYALGRGTTYADAPAVRKIVRDSRAEKFRFSTFIMGVVSSMPFQMRRS